MSFVNILLFVCLYLCLYFFNQLYFTMSSWCLQNENFNQYTPLMKVKWPSAIICWQPTLLVAWCLIWWFASIVDRMVIHDTVCPCWVKASLNQTKHKLKVCFTITAIQEKCQFFQFPFCGLMSIRSKAADLQPSNFLLLFRIENLVSCRYECITIVLEIKNKSGQCCIYCR